MKNEITKQTKTLFISAGHDDVRQGAYGNGYSEADIVLEFRDLVADALRGRVIFGRDGDRGINLPLKEAVRQARVRDVAVEFHCNAFDDPRVCGVETLGRTKHDMLGARLCEAVARMLGTENRGPRGEGDGQHSRLAFVSEGGGLILELFFLTNKDDLDAYLLHKYELAEAVAGVLVDEVAPHG